MSGVEFELTNCPAIFYNSQLLRDDDIFHFYIKVIENGNDIGKYDFIEISEDRYMMASNIGKIIFISKNELENRYHCIFDANGGYKIYKYILD